MSDVERLRAEVLLMEKFVKVVANGLASAYVERNMARQVLAALQDMRSA
jgi:hypothetical protein